MCALSLSSGECLSCYRLTLHASSKLLLDCILCIDILQHYSQWFPIWPVGDFIHENGVVFRFLNFCEYTICQLISNKADDVVLNCFYMYVSFFADVRICSSRTLSPASILNRMSSLKLPLVTSSLLYVAWSRWPRSEYNVLPTTKQHCWYYGLLIFSVCLDPFSLSLSLTPWSVLLQVTLLRHQWPEPGSGRSLGNPLLSPLQFGHKCFILSWALHSPSPFTQFLSGFFTKLPKLCPVANREQYLQNIPSSAAKYTSHGKVGAMLVEMTLRTSSHTFLFWGNS